jgi:hypothetical protein
VSSKEETVMKRKLAIVAASAFVMSSLMVAPALADHNVGPCNDVEEPGNSAYAKHHIVPVAKAQGMGHDGHKPGSHQGFSICLNP